MSLGIAARGVTRTFRRDVGVLHVDLAVTPGEVHALVGLNGAGKTTLMRLLLGMVQPTEGEVLVDGTSISALPASAWGRVGHMIDGARGYPDLRTRENLRVAARLHGVPIDRLPTVMQRAIEEFGLEDHVDVPTRRLSQGNRQRLGLAMAHQHDPALVVLDEPTNGLDPAGVIMLRDTLRRRADTGAGILVSSHHLDEVARFADRITVLNRGRIVGTLSPDQSEIAHAFFEMVRVHDERLGR